MDGGGRLLRSLGGVDGGFLAEARPRFAGPFAAWTSIETPTPAPRPRPQKQRLPERLAGLRRGWGVVLAAALFGSTGLYGAIRGGEYQTFIAANGGPADIAAKALGFSIDTVAITGIRELTPAEIIAGGDIDDKKSLALLDASALRDKLKAIPLVKDASVRKLFPNDLAIKVVERDPVALWQNDGQVSLIAADGVPIDDVHDARFNVLPFVVGPNANAHFDEYQALLRVAGDLRDKISAGMRVGDRRWTLKMTSGVLVLLPEVGAEEALRRMAAIEATSKVLEKDVISIDLRIKGRITARLSEDAAAQRVAALAKRSKNKASAT